VDTEASSPITYDVNVDSKASSPIPYNENMDSKASSPIPYNENMDLENSYSVTDLNQGNKPINEIIQQSSVSKDTQKGKLPKSPSELKTRRRGRKPYKPSKSKLTKLNKKLGESEGKKPVYRDSLESELPVLINHAKVRKGRSKNLSSKIKKKKAKRKIFGNKDKRQVIEEEKKEQVGGNVDRIYTEASSPIPYSGSLDMGQWSSVGNDDKSLSQDAANSLVPVCSTDRSEKTKQSSNAQVQLNTSSENRSRYVMALYQSFSVLIYCTVVQYCYMSSGHLLFSLVYTD
jgi:hypothetical protein